MSSDTIVFVDDRATVWHGDCRQVLPSLATASIDAVVTDPPYELGFMGKGWDATGIAYDVALWTEVLRVLKPGGHLLAFGGTRTSHRMVVAIEDAGFEVRDSIAWLYGSGFPKSLDVSKAIDKAAGVERDRTPLGSPVKRMIPGADQNRTGSWVKDNGREYQPSIETPATDEARQWDGWGTALKPAHEPICVARKPLDQSTVAENVLTHGTGAINVDACRVSIDDASGYEANFPGVRGHADNRSHGQDAYTMTAGRSPSTGRWPANVALDADQAAVLDRQSGTLTSGAKPARRNSDKFRDAYGQFAGQTECNPSRGTDVGGASRFFYVAKAATTERPRVDGTAHPTVKPLDLMRWLVRLVTPPAGIVLDPFAGSGTTAEACVLEGVQCVAVERDAQYIPLIVSRLSRPVQAHLFGGVAE